MAFDARVLAAVQSAFPGADATANDNARPGEARERAPAPRPAAPSRTEAAWHEALHSPVARTIANQVTRGLMGALLGKPPPRGRRRSAW
jgi:hypothetical protein